MEKIQTVGSVDQDAGVIQLNVLNDSQEYNLVRPYLYAADSKGWKISELSQVDPVTSRKVGLVRMYYRLHSIIYKPGKTELSKSYSQHFFDTVTGGTASEIKKNRLMEERILIRTGKKLHECSAVITRAEYLIVIHK